MLSVDLCPDSESDEDHTPTTPKSPLIARAFSVLLVAPHKRDTMAREDDSAPPPDYPLTEVESKHKRTWRGAKIVDKSRFLTIGEGGCRLHFNPVVSLCSILLIIAFILWCILEPVHANSSFKSAKTWVTMTFTWLYVGSQDIWAVVIIAIYFSKYGQMKLGKDDEEPEYSDGSWFAMLFACGVGVGLFFFGVAEPIWHYVGPNRYTKDKYMPDNELAQTAINLTLFHWGIHGWIVYVMIGIIMGFMTFRKGLPMTMKSCFYPLLGNRIYGWMGDLIDTFSILTTLFGVCTSLGFGTIQVNRGLNFINEDIALSTTNQVIIIWAITLVATISVVSGVGVGIRRLSEICFGLGMFIMLMVLFLEDTWYLLNLYCQSIGYYIQWIMQLGFHCDAFELSSRSYGADDRGRAFEDGEGDGPENWMDDWTIFYWGWWISWSPFVGMFIAKISRGRTIRQFINGAMTAPIIYSFLWMSIFGGGAIKIERNAAGVGLCCPKFDADFLKMPAADLVNIQVQPLNTIAICGATKACKPCEISILDKYIADNPTANAADLVSFINRDSKWIGKYLSETDRSQARLSCMASEEMWFAMISTYGDMGPFLCILSLVGIIFYFVTSSDSGSLVIDIMSANGCQDPPIPQRVFWALVEGATATALLVAGGSESLSALRTASVVAGLPYTIILCFVTISLWRALAMEHGDLDPYGPDFAISLIDPFTRLKPKLWLEFLKNIFITPVTLYGVYRCYKKPALFPVIASTICWLVWIALIIAELVHNNDPTIAKISGIYSIAWCFYMGFVTIVTCARAMVRSSHGISGNPVEDFFAALLVYPCVMIQLENAAMKGGLAPLMPDNPETLSNGKDIERNHETEA